MGEDSGVRRRGGEQKKAGGGGGSQQGEKKPERSKPFQGRYNPKVTITWSLIQSSSHPYNYQVTQRLTRPPVQSPSHPYNYLHTHTSTWPPVQSPGHPYNHPATQGTTHGAGEDEGRPPCLCPASLPLSAASVPPASRRVTVRRLSLLPSRRRGRWQYQHCTPPGSRCCATSW